MMIRSTLLLSLFVLLACSMNAQVVKGVISDQEGNPVPFAKAWIQSTSYGTIANGKGEYQINLDSTGVYLLNFSFMGYETVSAEVIVSKDVVVYDVTMGTSVLEIEEVKVTAMNKRSKGKKIMKQVIDKRKEFLDAADRYACKTYCFSSLDIRKTPKKGEEVTDSSAYEKKKLNITEWYGTSFFEASSRYKDEIVGFTDYTDKGKNTASVEVSFSGYEMLGENTGSIETNPYIFVNSLQDADINIFRSSIDAPTITQRPIISPLSFNAFMYYNFYLESSFFQNGDKIYEIRVEPVFRNEALFYGTLFIKDVVMVPISYELGVNQAAMSYFEEMRIVAQYEQVNEAWVPVQREFIYLIKEGRSFIHGNVRVSHSEYSFEFDDSKRNFWLESQSFSPEAFNRDTVYWADIRPFHLEPEEKQFIWEQDSIVSYETSEEYLKEQDSLYNTLSVWDFLFNGVGFRNTFKKQEIWFSPLIEQVIPFGVGGYRHALSASFEKEFKNAHAIDIRPSVDYGFKNKDLKGSLEVGYLYNPKRFGRASLTFGDTYDFINNYESIQGTIAPANRVRNRKVKAYHQFEVLNGLYLGTSATFSLRQAIQNIEYPEWVNLFGTFSEPTPFDDYGIFITEVELSYRFAQRFIFRGNKKIVTGTKWPLVSLLYKKGYPNVFGGQSDFDFLELRMKDNIDLNSWGQSEFKLSAGSFLRKKDLRVIENKYFRTSDLFFFSNPTESMQMLDTALNTNNSYLQANFIHHFNGFFLNKVWGLNRLKLEETVGGSALMIPDANFNQIEFYVGLERMFRIKKQLFKIGVYAVASDNNFDKAAIRWKIGVNFYDSFRKKWDY